MNRGAGLRLARGSCALVLAMAAAGCTSLLPPPQTAALRAAVPVDLAPRAEQREVPFFPQTPYHCGPAALATVLRHAGFGSTPERLAETVFLPAREGALQAEMLAAARREGALAVRLPGQLADLLREVQGGTPVVVLQNLGLSFAPRWHYAVVVGYDLGQQQIVLRSGTTEREVMALATFEYTWARSERWAMAALPPGRLPRTALENDAVLAAVGFERAAPPAQAALAYETVLQRWPANAVAAIGLGNSRYAAHDLAGAASAFEDAARRHDSAAAWNNLAAVRLELGQRDAAQAAARRAVERAEAAEPRWLPQARQTLASTLH